MDYKVLIDRYFSGMTSCEEEVELRRCLMHDDLTADMSLERECLLAMLQPTEYDCSEEMSAVSAMIDNLAVVETVTIMQQPVQQRRFLRYLAPVMAVAVAVLLLFFFFPYSIETVMDNEAIVAATGVDENSVFECIVIENSPAKIIAQSSAVDDVPIIAHVKDKESYIELDENPVYNLTEYSVEPKEANNGRFWGNIIAEPHVMPNSVAAIMESRKEVTLYLLNVYSLLEYLRYMHDDDGFSNFADMAKGVESMAVGQPYLPHVEKLIDSKVDTESLGNVQLLALDSIEFAPDNVPWNPATPLRVYEIRNAKGETIITFLFPICFDYQSVGFSDAVYVMDDESGDVYNVLGYKGGYTMAKRLVVHGCKGKNVLISLRFQKLKRGVKSITVHDPGHKSGVTKFSDHPAATAIVSGISVKKFKK